MLRSVSYSIVCKCWWFCVILTPRKDNQVQWRWLNLGGILERLGVCWYFSEGWFRNFYYYSFDRNGHPKAVTQCLKIWGVCFFGQELIPCWFSSLPPNLPLLLFLFGRWERGLCRFELSKDMNTNGTTSHISVEPPIQMRTPLVAEPYLSSVVVLSCMLFSQAVDLCYSSRKL